MRALGPLFGQQVAAFLAADRYRGLILTLKPFREGPAGYLALLRSFFPGRIYMQVEAVRQRSGSQSGLRLSRRGGPRRWCCVMTTTEHILPRPARPVASQDWFAIT